MIGYTITDKNFFYQNIATGDKWEIRHEEYQVNDKDDKDNYRVYYTARFWMPVELQEIEVSQPFSDLVPEAFQPFLGSEDKGLYVTENVYMNDYRATKLAFKTHALASSSADLEKKSIILYKDIMDNIHKYNIMGTLPRAFREAVKSGKVLY